MESKGWVIGIIIALIVLYVSCSRGCSEQSMTRNWGGETEVNLEPNRKLLEVTWKDSSLWYLTREMKEDEEAEDYIFQEKDTTGWLEGRVIIHEQKMDAEEYASYLEQITLQQDYYRTGNSVWSEEDEAYIETFITYENGIYVKIRDYEIDENGCLVYAE